MAGWDTLGGLGTHNCTWSSFQFVWLHLGSEFDETKGILLGTRCDSGYQVVCIGDITWPWIIILFFGGHSVMANPMSIRPKFIGSKLTCARDTICCHLTRASLITWKYFARQHLYFLCFLVGLWFDLNHWSCLKHFLLVGIGQKFSFLTSTATSFKKSTTTIHGLLKDLGLVYELGPAQTILIC